MKEINSHYVAGPDDISPLVIRECKETLIKLQETYKISLKKEMSKEDGREPKSYH